MARLVVIVDSESFCAWTQNKIPYGGRMGNALTGPRTVHSALRVRAPLEITEDVFVIFLSVTTTVRST